MGALHEDIHDFLFPKVTGWGIYACYILNQPRKHMGESQRGIISNDVIAQANRRQISRPCKFYWHPWHQAQMLKIK